MYRVIHSIAGMYGSYPEGQVTDLAKVPPNIRDNWEEVGCIENLEEVVEKEDVVVEPEKEKPKHPVIPKKLVNKSKLETNSDSPKENANDSSV